ncbi:MAG TPA: sigma-70 family RNA polymerase sigma factor [Pyrinomonadaceae bacterium]|nr:sigma-70 family RNA polymerase sigma factor [Pyrinomonadaceae bacterium]
MGDGFSGRDQQLADFIESISCGNEEALTALYDATNRLLYGLVLRILTDPDAAEEVLLDVYKQVWRKASSYDQARGNPLAWLMTIARSRAIDRLRSTRLERQRVEALDNVREIAASCDVERDAVLSGMRRVIRKALDSLPPEQREVIDLAYYGGLSQSEIAARIGQPLGTVKTRVRLGLAKLREALRPLDKEVG